MYVEHTKVDAISARNLFESIVRVSPSRAGYKAPRLISWNSATVHRTSAHWCACMQLVYMHAMVVCKYRNLLENIAHMCLLLTRACLFENVSSRMSLLLTRASHSLQVHAIFMLITSTVHTHTHTHTHTITSTVHKHTPYAPLVCMCSVHYTHAQYAHILRSLARNMYTHICMHVHICVHS